MKKLGMMTLNNSVYSVAKMLMVGSFFSHYDGRWMYSEHGETEIHLTDCDPTEHFEMTAEFSNGYSASACISKKMYSVIFPDNTRSVKFWGDDFILLTRLYAPRTEGEKQWRDWNIAQFS